MDFTVRPARAGDITFVTDMLVAAAFWRPDGPSGSPEEVLQDPDVGHYVDGWPQADDIGVIAEADHPIGAAWLRFFTAADPGYGFVDARTPEVSIGVASPWRGKGVGRCLLEALFATARDAGIPTVSLSVEPDNYAHRLYADIGFQPFREDGGSITMVLRPLSCPYGHPASSSSAMSRTLWRPTFSAWPSPANRGW